VPAGFQFTTGCSFEIVFSSDTDSNPDSNPDSDLDTDFDSDLEENIPRRGLFPSSVFRFPPDHLTRAGLVVFLLTLSPVFAGSNADALRHGGQGETEAPNRASAASACE